MCGLFTGDFGLVLAVVLFEILELFFAEEVTVRFVDDFDPEARVTLRAVGRAEARFAFGRAVFGFILRAFTADLDADCRVVARDVDRRRLFVTELLT